MIYNVIPLRDVVIYPGIVTPLFVGRRKSIHAIEQASKNNMQVVLVSQKSAEIDQPSADDLYDVGTLADIIQIMKLPDGTLKLLVEGLRRVKINQFTDKFLTECDIELLDETADFSEKEERSVRRMLIKGFERYLQVQQKQAHELTQALNDIGSLSLLADIIASHIQVPVEKKIHLLLETDVKARITEVMGLLDGEIEVIDLEKSIHKRVRTQIEKNNKEYYLNEQAKAIQKELEALDDDKSDLGKLEAEIKAADMPELVAEKVNSEFEKLKKMSHLSPEAVVIRNYLEHMIAYPWQKSGETRNNVREAQDILQASHYGLEEVKKRIVEYIAVQQRLEKPSGSILCLVGPPGVGKTSIGKSIASAVNREYVRMALGGIRDEAEIRGHRRTYIGSMPGRIVQNISKAGVNNPLFLLDEIDKMGSDHRGDPASAMLEVLDPEQNCTFNDHYMEVDIDLSNVMFVATANSLAIPEALLDRMEVIRIPGYTESEKVAIAKEYLIPRNIERNGLQPKEINITDAALKRIVENYTREAGVRRLDREIGKLCRKVVTEIALQDVEKVSVSKNNLSDYLGAPKYVRENLHQKDSIGRINGLAWTSVGGELLNIEVAVLPGKGKVHLTGKLGDVMKESVEAAMTVVKGHVANLGVSHTFFQEHDFHIHLPEAATPKDGPSAGTAMTIALLSAVMQQPIAHDLAMTGEVTLQGNVLPIGGLKEKLFAAAREGIKTVFIPRANEKDLAEIPAEITEALKIIPVSTIDKIVASVFFNKLNKLEKIERKCFLIEEYVQANVDISRQH